MPMYLSLSNGKIPDDHRRSGPDSMGKTRRHVETMAAHTGALRNIEYDPEDNR